ncbi:MAG: MerR family transcriptional regulator [Gammaproteobacteria bacterium]|nr:MerR family transcriptional regulator [Gammaproteobacteria bacterium]
MNNMEEKIYSISKISADTGVPTVTIRAWERRYGLLKPIRTEKGYRLYSQADIDRIHTILRYIKKGVAVGKVKALLDDKLLVKEPLGAEDVWQSNLSLMIAAIERCDQKALDAIYTNLLLLYTIEIITERLLIPLWTALGQRWQLKYQGSIAEEHFFSGYIRNKLGAQFHQLMTHTKGQRLLFACLPNQRHEFALLLFAIYVMQHDYEVIFLGANTPVEDIFIAAKHGNIEAIVLDGEIDDKIVSQLNKEIEDSKLPVFWYGNNSEKNDFSKIINLSSYFSDSFDILHKELVRCSKSI